jgi:carboxylesterase type B
MVNEVVYEDKVKKPTLTMKFLYELIRHNQYEYYKLSQRLDKVEQQLVELHKHSDEVASSAEHSAIEEDEDQGINTLQPVFLTPRSQRHPSTKKKKSIWSYWFRPHTS